DVAVDVYSLRRNGNEITGANASLGRDEQSPRSRLKKCHADNVSDAKNNVLRSAAVLKFADKPRHCLAQDVRDLGGDADKGVWKFFGVVPPPPHAPTGGPAGWHQGTAPRRKQRAQEC